MPPYSVQQEQTELGIVRENSLLLPISSTSTTKASHYSLRHCNAKWGHPERAERGAERRTWGSLPPTRPNTYGSQGIGK